MASSRAGQRRRVAVCRPGAIGALSAVALMVSTSAMGLGCDPQAPSTQTAQATARPPAPAPGYPARGAELDDAALDHYLPPPPKDAVAYTVRVPLRNGRTVPVKKRWIWVPDGQRLELAPKADGKLALRVPRGTKLWKEFYLETPTGLALVERRILLKVADANDENGWLLNGGWKFYASHHLPQRADGQTGFDNELTVPLQDDEAKAFMYEADQWLPTQNKAAATYLTMTGGGNQTYPYVFPGKTNCELCHGGATGAYANAEPHPVLAFGPHPDNLTPETFAAIAERGWVDAPEAVIAATTASAAASPASAPTSPASAPTVEDQPSAVHLAALQRELVDVLRNNCLSCHNPSPRAAAASTAFVLEPGQSYEALALAAQLAAKSSVMGKLAHPIVTPGAPEKSELWLRVRGDAERRRMPPAEGGLPERDEALIAQTHQWIDAVDLAGGGGDGGDDDDDGAPAQRPARGARPSPAP